MPWETFEQCNHTGYVTGLAETKVLYRNTCAESDYQITETMNLKKMRIFSRMSRWEKEKNLFQREN